MRLKCSNNVVREITDGDYGFFRSYKSNKTDAPITVYEFSVSIQFTGGGGIEIFVWEGDLLIPDNG